MSTCPILPMSLSLRKSCSTPPEVFWCISLYGVLTNAAQLCNVRQTNICMLLPKNPSSCPYFSRISSLLCLLQLNIPSWVCLSLSPVSTSGKHSFTCLPQQNTIQHNWLQRTLKFPLHQPFAWLFMLVPGLHACRASTLPTEIYLQVPYYFHIIRTKYLLEAASEKRGFFGPQLQGTSFVVWEALQMNCLRPP